MPVEAIDLASDTESPPYAVPRAPVSMPGCPLPAGQSLASAGGAPRPAMASKSSGLGVSSPAPEARVECVDVKPTGPDANVPVFSVPSVEAAPSVGCAPRRAWALEIGSAHAGLAKSLVNSGVPTLVIDHFSSRRAVSAPTLRVDLRSSAGWEAPRQLLDEGGLSFVIFEPPRGTLAPKPSLRATKAFAKSLVKISSGF